MEALCELIGVRGFKLFDEKLTKLIAMVTYSLQDILCIAENGVLLESMKQNHENHKIFIEHGKKLKCFLFF